MDLCYFGFPTGFSQGLLKIQKSFSFSCVPKHKLSHRLLKTHVDNSVFQQAVENSCGKQSANSALFHILLRFFRRFRANPASGCRINPQKAVQNSRQTDFAQKLIHSGVWKSARVSGGVLWITRLSHRSFPNFRSGTAGCGNLLSGVKNAKLYDMNHKQVFLW